MNDPAFEHNEQILEDLEWAIAANDGEFELHLLQCDFRLLRQTIVQEWKQSTKFSFREIEVKDKDHQLLKTIQEHLQIDKYPDALLIYDFKKSYFLPELLSNLNQSRDELKQVCSFPVILFMSEDSIQEFSKNAIDLKSWALPKATLKSPQDLIVRNLENLHQDIFKRLEKTTNFVGSWELWGKSTNEEISQTTALLGYLSDAEMKLLFRENPKLFAFIGFLSAREADWQQRDFRGLQHHFLCTGKKMPPKDRLDLYRETLKSYQDAIDFYWNIKETYPNSNVNISEIAIVSIHVAWLTLYWGDYSASKSIFNGALQLFEESEKPDLWACFAIGYGECLRYLKEWPNLKTLAERLLSIADNN